MDLGNLVEHLWPEKYVILKLVRKPNAIDEICDQWLKSQLFGCFGEGLWRTLSIFSIGLGSDIPNVLVQMDSYKLIRQWSYCESSIIFSNGSVSNIGTYYKQ